MISDLLLGILFKRNVVIVETVCRDEPRYCYHIMTFAGARPSMCPSLTPNDDDHGINRRRRVTEVISMGWVIILYLVY